MRGLSPLTRLNLLALGFATLSRGEKGRESAKNCGRLSDSARDFFSEWRGSRGVTHSA